MIPAPIRHADPNLDEATALLRGGRYREGFALYEQRTNLARMPLRQLGWPEWRGEPLDGKTIVVWGEQGLGDEIQMARFVRDLKARGAVVWITCNPLLQSLFAGLGADGVSSRIGNVVLPSPVDYWIASMSLPLVLGITLANLNGRPYLLPPPVEPTGRIGLCWRGNPENPRDSQRSLPSPDLLAATFPGGVWLEAQGDMSASAAQVAGLAAVVTVDTAWAHLAGALGVKTYLLLDAHNDWRWGGDGVRSPWYDSVTLCRQESPGDWLAPVRTAAAYLASTSQPATPPEATVQIT